MRAGWTANARWREREGRVNLMDKSDRPRTVLPLHATSQRKLGNNKIRYNILFASTNGLMAAAEVCGVSVGAAAIRELYEPYRSICLLASSNNFGTGPCGKLLFTRPPPII